MRSKAPLALMEQTVMLLVFALAAALCLRAFLWADIRSEENALRDGAIVQAQSAAEVLKSCGGNMAAAAARWGGAAENGNWTVSFDENWTQTAGEGACLLRVSPVESDLAYLGLARVEVYAGDTLLAALDVAWQEVAQ